MITLSNISKTFHAQRGMIDVLQNVNFHLASGESAVIFGASGAGKTTLLSLIGVLDDDYSGSVQIDEQAIEAMNDAQKSALRAKKIGFVFQTPWFVPHLTLIRNLEIANAFSGLKKSKKELSELFESLGLSGMEDALPHELSGGQAQRLALARALAGEPEILLADEPTGNLDHQTGETILDALFALTKEGKTLLVVTHDRRFFKRTTKRYELKSGRLIAHEGIETSEGVQR